MNEHGNNTPEHQNEPAGQPPEHGSGGELHSYQPHPHPDMVVSHHKRRLGGRRLWLTIAIVVVVLLLGGGAVVEMNGGFNKFFGKDTAGNSAANNGSSSGNGQSQTSGKMTTEQLSTAINNLYSKQDYQGAVKLAEAQVNRQDPASLLILAAAYTNHQEYDKAFAIYDQLDANNQLAGSDTMTAGEVAQLAGNKQKAIAYFQKAKAKIQAEKPTFETQRELSFIDQQLAELQK